MSTCSQAAFEDERFSCVLHVEQSSLLSSFTLRRAVWTVSVGLPILRSAVHIDMYTYSNSAMALICIDQFCFTSKALMRANTPDTLINIVKQILLRKLYLGPLEGHLECIVVHMSTHRVLHLTTDKYARTNTVIHHSTAFTSFS